MEIRVQPFICEFVDFWQISISHTFDKMSEVGLE